MEFACLFVIAFFLHHASVTIKIFTIIKSSQTLYTLPLNLNSCPVHCCFEQISIQRRLIVEFVCLFVIRSFFIMLQLQPIFFTFIKSSQTRYTLPLNLNSRTANRQHPSLLWQTMLSFRKQTILTLNSDASFSFLFAMAPVRQLGFQLCSRLPWQPKK